jgi:hypothetical protein
MRALGSVVALAAMVGSSALAQTVDPRISAVATSIPADVTVSMSSSQSTPVTYVAYLFTLTNGGGSAIQSISINGKTSVSSELTPAVIQGQLVNPQLPTQCAFTTPTEINCDFGAEALPPGGSKSFPVIVAVPQFVGDPVTGQSIRFDYIARIREGKSGTGSPKSDGILTGGAVTNVVKLSTDSVTSLVIKNGGKFFTGNNGITSPQDTFTTIVSVPALSSGAYTVANVKEKKPAGNDPCPVQNSSCKNLVDILIPDQIFQPTNVTDPLNQFLLITLRLDASEVKGGLNSAKVFYFDTTLNTYVEIFNCDPWPGPGVPRCIYDRKDYKKGDPAVTLAPGLLGDREIRVIAEGNGRIAY